MNPETIDWRALERLRGVFLNSGAGVADYWQCEQDVAGYDATFAQRIGWKWDYVFAELQRRTWTPPPISPLLDWGCGSGIAARAFLDHYGAEAVSGLWLWDRSALAMSFAARRARDKYPRLQVSTGLPPSGGGTGEFTLLLSHVLAELDSAQLDGLLSLAARSACVLWVEPGTHTVSRGLGAVRERLREQMQAVAPCTHQRACGMLAPANARHWCHHFAAPPRGVFTDGDWARFAAIMSIDLRSLPLSYLVMDRRPPGPLPPGATRVIGTPRVYKGHSLLFGCDASGVRDRTLAKRAFPELFRRIKKRCFPTLMRLQCEGLEIVEAAECHGTSSIPQDDGS